MASSEFISEAVKGIVGKIGDPGYDFEGAVNSLPPQAIPTLVNKLSKAARDRATQPIQPARADW